MNSICKFIPSKQISENIQTLSLVYEVNPQRNATLTTSTVYRIHYVTEGTAKVRCANVTAEVKKGDVFFAFPAVDFAIYGEADFKFMYISYMGIRAQAEMEKLGINTQNFVFENIDGLHEFWMQALSLKYEFIHLVSEGVLLYTLARIGDIYSSTGQLDGIASSSTNASLVKTFIDEHFRDSDISSESISMHFSYSKKYISTLFKKQFKVGIVEYIRTLRINYACSLIENRYTNITEIARMSGYDDALYFSKVFKQKIGMSPKQYIQELN